MANFTYKSLDSLKSFRLLKLEPGRDNDPLICEHDVYEIRDWHSCNEDMPSFEALSYVWGSAQPVHEIQCNGKTLRISKNLRDALYRLRSPFKHRFVWADAICIDQSNLRERKMQVALMRTIYSKAKRVMIYLGSENNKMRETQTSFVQDIRRYYYSELGIGPEGTRTVCRPKLPDASSSFWPLLAEFFDNPWFSRIWVIQEVAESQKACVMLGTGELPWDAIVHLAQRLLKDPYLAARVLRFTKTRGIRNVLFMNNRARTSEYDPILALLQSTRDFGSSDPRDKIYAILHKPTKQTCPYVQPQFIHYRRYAETAIQSIALLYLWSSALECSPIENQFWCMLISIACITYFVRLDQSIRAIAWDSCKRMIAHFNHMIMVPLRRYLVVETIQTVLSITADYSVTTQSLYTMIARRLIQRSKKLTVLSYVNHGSTTETSYPSWVPRWDISTQGIEVLSALPRHPFQASATTTHNPTIPSLQTDHLPVEGICFSTIISTSEIMRMENLAQNTSPTKFHQNIHEKIGPHDKAEPLYPTGESRRGALAATLRAGRLAYITSPLNRQRSIDVARKVCYGRRKFVTENGYIGIGPASIREGDLVCVLFGGCVPYILRPTDTDNMCNLVGECYVHGIMYGETVRLWEEGNLAKNTFVLC